MGRVGVSNDLPLVPENAFQDGFGGSTRARIQLPMVGSFWMSSSDSSLTPQEFFKHAQEELVDLLKRRFFRRSMASLDREAMPQQQQTIQLRIFITYLLYSSSLIPWHTPGCLVWNRSHSCAPLNLTRSCLVEHLPHDSKYNGEQK